MTAIYRPPYVYTLNFSNEVIEGIRADYFNKYNYSQRKIEERCFGHYTSGLADIVKKWCPSLSPHLMDTGLVIVLDPGSETNIHIDQRRDSIVDRNIGINFPIKMTKSLTAFYNNPDIVFAYDIDTAYSTGHYYKKPDPVLTFEMENQAVLLNTAIYHQVSNLSDVETRVMLSISFNADYTFDQSLDILQQLGYAN